MKNVFKVTYDIRLGRSRNWLGHRDSGIDSRMVLAGGDARTACQVLEREEKTKSYNGKSVTGVRILKVELIATNVLV